MSLLAAMMQSAGVEPDRGVPNRVQASMAFVSLMRQTGVRPPDFEGGCTREIPQSKKEREAYCAALECLKGYFNGEQFLANVPPAEPREPDPPTDAQPASHLSLIQSLCP